MHLRLPTVLLVSALSVALTTPALRAQDSRLPDIGSSAGEMLGPAKQAEYGGMLLRELRNYGYLIEDPLIEQWLDGMGQRLGSHSGKPRQQFTFFMLKERQINAFATLGGYIGVNSGLVLNADREDEVASVLSHEIAHVTQDHVLRGAERAQRDQLPILLGILAAVAAAQASSGSSGDATMASIASGMGLIAQRQINYTRSMESEADRVGIQTLARSGYDVDAMAEFFGRLQKVARINQGDERSSTPDYLRTHPVTLSRISESHERAERIKRGYDTVTATITATPGGVTTQQISRPPDYSGGSGSFGNPMLPASLQLPAATSLQGDSGLFEWARERLRVLSARSPSEAINEYEQLQRNGGQLDDAQRYGLAVAYLLGNNPAQAASALASLHTQEPDNLWVELALAQAESANGRFDLAEKRFEKLLGQHPGQRAITLAYAQVLNEQGRAETGQRAQAILRPLLPGTAADPTFQRNLARACELAGDEVRASEAWAEVAYLNGRPEQALAQLRNIKKRDDLDYYARMRVDGRIVAITPEVLELQRQGVHDPDLKR